MANQKLIAASLLIVAGAFYYSRKKAAESEAVAYTDDASTAADAVLTGGMQSAFQFVDGVTGGMLKISAMANVSPAVLQNKNVQALLRVIRTGEGTADAGGYARIFGGETFKSFADHPRKAVTKWGLTSTAAGAYQFLSSTWDETRRLMKLADFSPASQDLAAVGRIAARGALTDVIAGRFTTAIRKINREWASLPGSPYGQKTLQFGAALAIYQGNGGQQIEQTALA